MKVVLGKLFDAAMTDNHEEARNLAIDFDKCAMELMKFSKWCQDPQHIRNLVSAMSGYVKIARSSEVLDKLKANEVDFKKGVPPTIVQACGGKSILAEHNQFARGALAQLFGEETSANRLTWFDAFVQLLDVCFATLFEPLKLKVEAATKKLDDKLTSFSCESSSTDAEAVKGFDVKLRAEVSLVNDLYTGFSCEPAEPHNCMQAAEASVARSTGMTVAWGCRTLLNFKAFTHASRGKPARTKLQAIYDQHMSDAGPSDFWSAELKAEVEAALSGQFALSASEDAGGEGQKPPNQAASSASAAPAPPAAKRRGGGGESSGAKKAKPPS
jgi:hypothetical protein